jgi:Icc-related predicted phosphoesterase
MASGRVTKIICAASPAGSTDALEALVAAADEREADAIALVGDLGGGGSDSLRALLRVLARGSRPAYWVPGPGDAPIESYLREAQNIEVVAQSLRGVHGAIAFAPGGHVIFAGFGGAVSDDPEAAREEQAQLSYPRWEPEYRLKVLTELDEHQIVLLFATPPAHKGLGVDGSEVLAELIGTHRPRLVVCGGPPAHEMLGRTLVVAPGSLHEGHFAVVDLQSHDVTFEQLAAGSRAT